jgi:hypothetical protein
MKDFLGQDICAGQTIVYPGRKGSRMWMNRAIVQEVLYDGIRVQRDDGGLRVLKCPWRVVVIHKVEGADATI